MRASLFAAESSVRPQKTPTFAHQSAIIQEGGRLYRHATFYTIDEYLNWAKANPDLAK